MRNMLVERDVSPTVAGGAVGGLPAYGPHRDVQLCVLAGRKGKRSRELLVDDMLADRFGLRIKIIARSAANDFRTNVVQGVGIVDDCPRLLTFDGALPPRESLAMGPVCAACKA